jgi:hypothetical protein
MRTSLSAIRASLSTALGFAALACGGQSRLEHDGGDDTVGNGGTGGTAVTGGSGGAVVTGGSGGTAGTGGGSLDLSCNDPQPVWAYDGSPTGFVSCDGGFIHRPELSDCPSKVPRPFAITETTNPVQCRMDSDCTLDPFPHCVLGTPSVTGETTAVCQTGCVRDADCAAGSVCLCGDPVGTCVSASCTTDADCDDLLCVSSLLVQPCGDTSHGAFVCQTRDDICRGLDDCMAPSPGAPTSCLSTSGKRQCRSTGVCGRPFLVDGEARLAKLDDGERGWASGAEPNVLELDRATRTELAEHFAQLGLMEHASVAAFARFTLELLAVGAPSELVEASGRALGDEIRHANVCFGLASAYAGRPLGPGALSADGALGSRSFEAIAHTAIAEACIGETLAAVEAAEAAEHARDPVIRALLFAIAEDERRHAELGWRFLDWALETATPELRARLLARLSEAIALARLQTCGAGGPSGAGGESLLEHGVLDAERLRETRRRALDELVLPLARGLGERAFERAA